MAAVYALLLESTWTSAHGIGQVIFKATPLVFTGLAVALAFRAGLFNIGAEGQLIVGAFATLILTIISMIVGLEETHKCGTGKAVIAVLAPLVGRTALLARDGDVDQRQAAAAPAPFLARGRIERRFDVAGKDRGDLARHFLAEVAGIAANEDLRRDDVTVLDGHRALGAPGVRRGKLIDLLLLASAGHAIDVAEEEFRIG